MKVLDYTIRAGSKKDLKRIVKFLKRLGKANSIHLKSSEPFLLWKYRYFKCPPQLTLVERNTRLVGMGAAIPVTFSIAKKKLKAIWGVDVILDPSHRKFPLSYYLVNKDHPKTQLRLTFAITQEISHFFQRLGWLPLACSAWVLSIRKTQNFQTFFPDDKFEVLGIFDSRFNTFFKRVAHQYSGVVCRNQDYLSWRYSQHPLYCYRTIVAFRKKKMIGYVVTRIDQRQKCGYILDLFCDLSVSTSIASLLFKALSDFQSQKMKYAYCLLSHHRYLDIFKKCGFSFYQKEFCLIDFKDKRNNMWFLKNRDSFHMMMGDGDFRGAK